MTNLEEYSAVILNSSGGQLGTFPIKIKPKAELKEKKSLSKDDLVPLKSSLLEISTFI
jgi:hypothetical protein